MSKKETSRDIKINKKDLIQWLQSSAYTSGHSTRYVYALMKFLGEFAELAKRWDICILEDGAANITLPEDLENELL